MLKTAHSTQAAVPTLGNDNVIEELNVKKFSSFTKVSRYQNIFWTWFWITAGMIMGHDDRSGTIPHCLSKDFASTDDGHVHGANVDVSSADKLIF
jgi:hypothetical protein